MGTVYANISGTFGGVIDGVEVDTAKVAEAFKADFAALVAKYKDHIGNAHVEITPDPEKTVVAAPEAAQAPETTTMASDVQTVTSDDVATVPVPGT